MRGETPASGLTCDRLPPGFQRRPRLARSLDLNRSAMEIAVAALAISFGIDCAQSSNGGVSPLIRPFGPPSPSRGEGIQDGHNPSIVSISRAANPLTPLVFEILQRHQPAIAGTARRLLAIPSVGRASDPTPR